MALKIIGIVLFSVVALIFVFLMLPVDVIIKIDKKESVKIVCRFLGKIFGENPNPNSTVSKELKKLIGLSKTEKPDSVKGSVRKEGLAETVGRVAHMIKLLLGRIIWLLKYCRLKSLLITCVCADDDAAATAMDYGLVCAALYPMVGFIQSAMKTGENAVDVQVKCDFDGASPQFNMNMIIRVKLLYVALALFYIVKQNFKREVYNED